MLACVCMQVLHCVNTDLHCVSPGTCLCTASSFYQTRYSWSAAWFSPSHSTPRAYKHTHTHTHRVPLQVFYACWCCQYVMCCICLPMCVCVCPSDFSKGVFMYTCGFAESCNIVSGLSSACPHHSWSSGEGTRPAGQLLLLSSWPCHQLWSSLEMIWMMSPTPKRIPASLQGMRSSREGSYSNWART